MKFSIKDKRYQYLDPSIQQEISEKFFAAEKNIAVVRIFVVLLNSFVYLFLLDKTLAIEDLANLIIMIANAYGVFVMVFNPYKKFPKIFTSYFTSSTDGLLIALWIIATGGFESPFYVLWYVSILAIAMRYSKMVTYRTSIVYGVLYIGIFLLDKDYFLRSPQWSDLIIRLGYLAFISVLGGLMTQETIDQIEAKIIVKKSEEAVRKKEHQLKEAHKKLEQRVEERTKELAESNKQLLKINEEIDSFVYSASHDLKSPILNIEALLKILYEIESNEPEFEKSIKDKLIFSVEKMKKTISHLAEVAKAQKEMYDDVGPVKFEEVLYELIRENEEIIKIEQVQLEYNFELADTIICSKTCLKSIMYNFLTNSIKYKDPARPPIIKFYSERGNDFVKLVVNDNGLGIDLQKNGAKLFSLFKRFHDHVEGAGIGLYTVKKMVEKYNGDIDVESQPGKGTTFMVRFKSVMEKAPLSL